MSNQRSADAMSKILSQPDQVEALKIDPLQTVEKAKNAAVATTPLSFATDPWLYRLVISFLGLTLLTVTVGTITLVLAKEGAVTIPDGLVALGSAAVGALAGLLAPAPTDR